VEAENTLSCERRIYVDVATKSTPKARWKQYLISNLISRLLLNLVVLSMRDFVGVENTLSYESLIVSLFSVACFSSLTCYSFVFTSHYYQCVKFSDLGSLLLVMISLLNPNPFFIFLLFFYI